MEVLRGVLILASALTVVPPEPVSADTLGAQGEVLRKLFTDLHVHHSLRPPGKLNTYVSYFGRNVVLQGEPVMVTVSLHVLDVTDIDDDKQEMKLNFYLRQSWNDPRLKYSTSEARLEHVMIADPSKLWVPDLFLLNEKNSRIGDVTTKNAMIRIKRNGDVLYSTRITATLSCPMDHSKYPFDKQSCSLNMESYGHRKKDLVFVWNETTVPVTIGKQLTVKPFQLLGYGYDYCDSHTSTGEYSCLKAEFLVRRKGTGRAILSAYLPLSALVVLGAGNLWNYSKSKEKIHLLIAAVIWVLTVFKSSQVSSEAPTTGDYTALECWAMTCLVLTGLSTFVLTLALRLDHNKSEKNSSALKTATDVIETKEPPSSQVICVTSTLDVTEPLTVIEDPGEAAVYAACLGIPEDGGGRLVRVSAILVTLSVIIAVVTLVTLTWLDDWRGLATLTTFKKFKY